MKEITFCPMSAETETIPPPKPAYHYIPEWYKNIKAFNDDEKKPTLENGFITNRTLKSCMPFLDSLKCGYIQEAWTDIIITFKDESFSYHYSVGPEPMSYRDTVSVNLPSVFAPFEFIWRLYWAPKLDDGYSALITQPFNRFDLPFVNTSGIIDADKFFHTTGNYPFYVYKDTEIFIPQGTPLYQIIPIKRDNWKSDIEDFDEKRSKKRAADAQRMFTGTYKKLFYQKKSYT